MSHVRDSEDPFLYLGNPLIFCRLTCCVAPRSDHAELSVQAGYEMDEKKKKKKERFSLKGRNAADDRNTVIVEPATFCLHGTLSPLCMPLWSQYFQHFIESAN